MAICLLILKCSPLGILKDLEETFLITFPGRKLSISSNFSDNKLAVLFSSSLALCFCEAQGKGRAKGRLRKLIVDY